MATVKRAAARKPAAKKEPTMAGDYRVYDHQGKSLTGKDSVDRQTAKRVYDEAKRKAGRGEAPTLVRKGQDKELASRG